MSPLKQIAVEHEGKGGKVFTKTYPIPDYDELTLDHWKTLTVPQIVTPAEGSFHEMLGFNLEMLHRYTGIPKKSLEAIDMEQIDLLIDHIGIILEKAVEQSNNDFADYTPPKELTHEGVTFVVPNPLEKHTAIRQWLEINEAHKIEHQADIYRHFLSILLVEKGKKFDPADVEAKDVLFGSLPLVTVFPLCAFFFESSERFRTLTNRFSTSYLMSVRRQVAQALRISQSDTDQGQRSSA